MRNAKAQRRYLHGLIALSYALCAFGLPAVWHQSLDHNCEPATTADSHGGHSGDNSGDHCGKSSTENCQVCAHIAFSKVKAHILGSASLICESAATQATCRYRALVSQTAYGTPSCRAPPLL